jgi:sarcosine oxidase
MIKDFDVIVLGLGANGSSAVYHLSKTGSKVLGIDRFTPPHTHGSSHGQSRIIRQAYHENPLYVPLVKEAYNLWYEIEKTAGKKLFLKTGGLMLGSADSAVINGARLSAETCDIPFEYLNNNAIKKIFPAFWPSHDTVGLLEKDAGILFPEACVQTYLQEAHKNSAVLHNNERVIRIVPNENFIEIITDKTTYYTSKLIISAGAWLNELMPDLHLPLTVERQVLYWFINTNKKLQQHFIPANLPVYIWEYLPGKMFYGFPDLGDGIKIAFHHAGEPVTPDTLTKAVSEDEINSITAVAEKYLNIDAKFNYSATCMYTNTPDENFIIDFHPHCNNIIIASPCSGHGFKFASLTGKILSDMATGQQVLFDLSPFRISRFA